MFKPNFLVIGAQKAGTTSLINYMDKHPEIFIPEDKEVSNFYNDKNYNEGFKKISYQKYFSDWSDQKWGGNAPVNTLYFAEETSKNIFEYNSAMKLIAILRNPVERAYSAYWYFKKCGLEKGSFESALQREDYILKNGNFQELCDFTYISHGFYYEQLQPFQNYFGKDQILILLYDDLKDSPEKVMKQIFSFLNINVYQFSEDTLKSKHNASSKAKIKSINNIIYKNNILKRLYQKSISENFRQKIKYNVIRKIEKLNSSKFDYPPMHLSTKQYLIEIFNPHNDALQKLIKRDLSAWYL